MRLLAEVFVPAGGHEDIDDIDGRARAAAEGLRLEGTPVTHLRSILVPADEMCILHFEAPSPDDALEALRRAGVTSDRLVEAVERAPSA